MFEPGPTFATREDALAAEVEAIQAELTRIDSRLAALRWEGSRPRPSGTASWEDFCFGRPVEHDHSDVPQRVLMHKRDALVLELERLRAELVGQSSAPRRGAWG